MTLLSCADQRYCMVTPTVQVMHRHLNCGNRASLRGCPTPSVDQATCCQKDGEGHWQINLTGEMAYRHFNGEEGPDKGPRLRPEPLSIRNNGANPQKRSQTGVEFLSKIHTELHVRPHKMAALKVSGGSTRSPDTNKLKIRPTIEATTCPYNNMGPKPVEYAIKHLDILMGKKPTQMNKYLKNHRTRRIYTRVTMVSKRDQEICGPDDKDSYDASSYLYTNYYYYYYLIGNNY